MKKASSSNHVLVDTNILILSSKSEEPEASFLRNLIRTKRLAFSPIVISEFLVQATGGEKAKLEILVSKFGSCPIDENTADIAANYRRGYSRKIHRAYLLDCFIAASCKQHNLTLVTNNKKDFPMKDIPIYKPKEVV